MRGRRPYVHDDPVRGTYIPRAAQKKLHKRAVDGVYTLRISMQLAMRLKKCALDTGVEPSTLAEAWVAECMTRIFGKVDVYLHENMGLTGDQVTDLSVFARGLKKTYYDCGIHYSWTGVDTSCLRKLISWLDVNRANWRRGKTEQLAYLRSSLGIYLADPDEALKLRKYPFSLFVSGFWQYEDREGYKRLSEMPAPEEGKEPTEDSPEGDSSEQPATVQTQEEGSQVP